MTRSVMVNMVRQTGLDLSSGKQNRNTQTSADTPGVTTHFTTLRYVTHFKKADTTSTMQPMAVQRSYSLKVYYFTVIKCFKTVEHPTTHFMCRS